MKITLKIEGKDRIFDSGFLPGRVFRETVVFQKNIKNGLDLFDTETLDSMAAYVVGVFGNQFTIDQYYDGIASDKMASSALDLMNAVLSGAAISIGGNPDDPNSEPGN